MRPSFAVEESVRTLGANLKAARLRRRLPQSVVAERAGISLNTLSKLENGDCGIAIGNVASVLQALGLGTPLSLIHIWYGTEQRSPRITLGSLCQELQHRSNVIAPD